MDKIIEKRKNKLKEYIKKGWIKPNTTIKDVKFEDGDAYLEEEHVLLPIGYISGDGYTSTRSVLWID